MKALFKRLFSISCAAILILSLFSCADKSTDGFEKSKSEYEDQIKVNNLIGTIPTDGEKDLWIYFFSLDDGSAVVETALKGEKKITQSIPLPKNGEYYALLDFEFAFENACLQDMNFDGFDDLYIPCSNITANLQGMAWLWDNEEKCFTLSEELSALTELTLFSEDELITSQDYSTPGSILCTEYKWEEGELTKVGEYTVTTD